MAAAGPGNQMDPQPRVACRDPDLVCYAKSRCCHLLVLRTVCRWNMLLVGWLVMMAIIHLDLSMGQQQGMGGRCSGTAALSCLNGGACQEVVVRVSGRESSANVHRTYRCQCPPQFYGDMCEFCGERCGDVYCINGGLCIHELNVCDCPPEWDDNATCSRGPIQGQPGVFSSRRFLADEAQSSRPSTGRKTISSRRKALAIVLGIIGGLIIVGIFVGNAVDQHRKKGATKEENRRNEEDERKGKRQVEESLRQLNERSQ